MHLRRNLLASFVARHGETVSKLSNVLCTECFCFRASYLTYRLGYVPKRISLRIFHYILL